MAQTNFTPIQLYYSTTGAAAPTAGNLANGELAINITDGKLFYKDNLGAVQVLATKAGASGDVVGPASSTDNALVRFDSTTGKLVQNSVGVLSDTGDLTGIAAVTMSGALTLSGGTANGVAYLNGSKVLTTGSALTFDGTTLTNAGVISTGFAGNGTAVEVLQLKNLGSGDNTQASLAFYAAGTKYAEIIGGYSGAPSLKYSAAASSGYHQWQINNSEQMRLTSTGLGIGTSSPLGRLHTSETNGINYFESPGISSIALQFRTNGTNRYRIGTPSASADLQFLAGGTTETMRLDSSGNLGLGVTLSAWFSSYKALQVNSNGSLASNTDFFAFSNNVFTNSSGNDIYLTTGFAGRYRHVASNGAHQWYTAPSGTAGNAISFTQAMDLATSSGASTLTVNSAINTASAMRLTTNGGLTAGLFLAAPTVDHSLGFQTAGTEKMRIDSSGNLLVGTTSNQTGAKVNAAGGVGTANTATNRFATVEYGSGASGTFTTITVSFTVNSSASTVILEVLMTGFASVYLDHVAARYSNQTAVVMRNSASAGTTVASLAVDGAGLVYTLTITTSVTHPVVKVKATVGGLGSTTTLPTIAFA
jgi:hypothetical protein